MFVRKFDKSAYGSNLSYLTNAWSYNKECIFYMIKSKKNVEVKNMLPNCYWCILFLCGKLNFLDDIIYRLYIFKKK